jgi:hypothetical protein
MLGGGGGRIPSWSTPRLRGRCQVGDRERVEEETEQRWCRSNRPTRAKARTNVDGSGGENQRRRQRAEVKSRPWWKERQEAERRESWSVQEASGERAEVFRKPLEAR